MSAWRDKLAPPLLSQLRGYRAPWLGSDVSAGLAVAAVGLPSAIAYPAIAGLPPETGIYASIAAAFGYALFGPSRRLIVGPDAATMTVLAGALAAVTAAGPGGGPAQIVAAAGAIAILVGLLCLAARALGLGEMANFLSRPILAGFFAGISLSILVGQIGRVTGLTIEGSGLLPPIVEMLREADAIHWPSLALAAGAFAILQTARIWSWSVPGPVLVVVLGIALSATLGLAEHGVRVVGTLPAGLPEIGPPDFAGLPLRETIAGAGAVFLVAFGSGMVTARSFAMREGERVDANRELTGFGGANVFASLLGGFPVTSSDSRTAINISVGGRTQLAAIVSGLALISTLLFLGPALAVLPVPALGAILMAAAISMIDLESLREVWRISRAEFVFAMIAFFGAVSFGVLGGIVIAVGASLLHLLRGAMRPRIALLGRIPGRPGFHRLHRAAEARPEQGLMIALIEGDLLFFNAEAVETQLDALVAQDEAIRWVVLDGSAMAQIDASGALTLRDFADALSARGATLALAEFYSEPLAVLERAGVVERIGAAQVFATLEDALPAFRAGHSVKRGLAPSARS